MSATDKSTADGGYVVELRDVTKTFGDVVAVDRVSVQIRSGEFVTLLGPSGCGKTTTLRLISGFEEPTAGEILLNGKNVAGVPPYERDTTVVFQDYALFPHRNVEQNVAFGLRMRREKREAIQRKVEEMLSMVDLEGLGKRRISELSGGQQQRVALARSLILEPSVMLLDEPLGSLDLKLRKQMQIELKRIQRQLGTTSIYVTHDQEEALVLSDRVAVMKSGRIEQFDRAEVIYQRPATSFVADFIGEANILTGEVVDVAGGLTRVKVQGTEAVVQVPFEEKEPPSEGAQVKLVVRPEKMSVHARPSQDINVIEARLDEVIFIGPALLVELSLPDGSKFTVRSEGATSLPTRGGAITVGWPVQETILLTEGE